MVAVVLYDMYLIDIYSAYWLFKCDTGLIMISDTPMYQSIILYILDSAYTIMSLIFFGKLKMMTMCSYF